MSLGSRRIDPVAADVASFFDDEVSVKFALSSPKAYVIVKYYQTFATKDIQDLSINVSEGKITIKYLKNGEPLLCEIGDSKKVVSFLSTVKSANTVSWYIVDINDAILQELLRIKIGKMLIFRSTINVSPKLFEKFLQQNPRSVELSPELFHDLELCNNLVTDNNMKLLKRVSIRCATRGANRVTTVSDEFLRFNWENGGENFSFKGFITQFTVKNIVNYVKVDLDMTDCGILGCEQLEEAINYTRENGIQPRLRSWNEQKFLAVEILEDDRDSDDSEWEDVPLNPDSGVRFAVSLTQNCQGHVTDIQIPTDVASAKMLKLFEHSIQAVDSVNSEDFSVTELYDLDTLKFSYDNGLDRFSKLTIDYADKTDSIPVRLTRTDISEDEGYLRIKKFLKICRHVDNVTWDALSVWKMNEEIAEILKQLTDKLVIGNEWPDDTIEWLNDQWLISFVTELTPTHLSAEECITQFTTSGIKAMLKALERKPEHVDVLEYNLGTIEKCNVEEVKKMVEEIEADEDGPWKAEKEFLNHYQVSHGPSGVFTRKGTVLRHGNITVKFNYPQCFHEDAREGEELDDPADDDFEDEDMGELDEEVMDEVGEEEADIGEHEADQEDLDEM